MVYIYDILVNFNDLYLFDFFEWNMNDEIENLKKVRLYRVSSHTMHELTHYKTCVSSIFLSEIYNTCELYTKNSTSSLPYVCLFSDGNEVVSVEFDCRGVSQAKSRLILEEEEEVLDVVEDMDIYPLSYQVIENESSKFFLTRKDMKVKKYLTMEIEDAYKKKEEEKLRFLYEEYFEKTIDNFSLMKEELLSSMKEFLDYKHLLLYDLLKLSHKKKQV